MNHLGRLLLFFYSISFLQAQVSKIPVDLKTITVKGDATSPTTSVEVYVADLKVDTTAFGASYSWKEFVLYPEVYTSDGVLVYNGFIANKGNFWIRSYKNRSSLSALFTIPVEKMACSAGEQSFTFHFYLAHESGSAKTKVASFSAKKMILSSYETGYWEVVTVRVPESNSYDVRFLSRGIDGCNSDLYVTLARSSQSVFRSSYVDNICYLNNVKMRTAVFPKSNWVLHVYDFDNTSFDDRICSFDLGNAATINSTATEFRSGGSVLSITLKKEPSSLDNFYANQVRLREFRTTDGVSGVLYGISGKSVSKLNSSEFTASHFAGKGRRISDFKIISETSDSVFYFTPFYQYSEEPISAQLYYHYQYGGEFAYQYASSNSVTPPQRILDNSFSDFIVNQQKIQGTMCLVVSAKHRMPALYKNLLQVKSTIGNGIAHGVGFGNVLTVKEAESTCAFYTPLSNIESLSKRLPVSLDSYVLKDGIARNFSMYADTLRDVSVALEEYTFKIMAQLYPEKLQNGSWEFHIACNDSLIVREKAEANVTEIKLRKHAEDDLVLKFVTTEKNDYPHAVTVPSAYFKKKGKKKKLKTGYGIKKFYIMRI